MISSILEVIARERPVGTPTNDEILDFLEKQFNDMNYSVRSLPFDCAVWEKGKSVLAIDNYLFEVEPSPFSKPFKGNGKLSFVKTAEELAGIECSGDILVLSGKITGSPLQPKDYPFYYPDEHRKLISLFEKKRPKAIIAITGKNSLNGQNPFPLFEDGNFLIPSANIGKEYSEQIERLAHLDMSANLVIDSHKTKAKSRQIVASKKAKSCR